MLKPFAYTVASLIALLLAGYTLTAFTIARALERLR